MNLFKLETKKINWRGYFLANFIIILTCLFITMMRVFVPFINIEYIASFEPLKSP